KKRNNNFNAISVNNRQQENTDLDVERGIINSNDNNASDFANDDPESLSAKDDYETILYNPISSFNSIGSDERTSGSLMDIQSSPEEITVSSSGEASERGYFILVE
ncbi:unnamed protein product, partial [Rotaria sordida]